MGLEEVADDGSILCAVLIEVMIGIFFSLQLCRRECRCDVINDIRLCSIMPDVF